MKTVNTIFLCASLCVALYAPLTHNQPQVLITSIPKCGTNLLRCCIELICEQTTFEWCKKFTILKNEQMINSSAFTFMSHAFYAPCNIKQIFNKPWRTFFIYRDPRDQIVSMAHWIRRKPKLRPASIYSEMNIDELILELIERNAPVYSLLFEGEEIKDMHGIADFYALYMPWKQHPDVYTTRFETLVGPLGGGDAEIQLTEIMNIAAHMNMPIMRKQAMYVAENLFGNGYTFNEGQIGSWKKYFNKKHKQAFKKIAGQLLIDLGYERDLNW